MIKIIKMKKKRKKEKKRRDDPYWWFDHNKWSTIPFFCPLISILGVIKRPPTTMGWV